jgi:site-specific recombinase XerD
LRPTAIGPGTRNPEPSDNLNSPVGFKAHPHMLRHACGFALANKGHDTRALQAYLGHRNIQHTVRYTELSPDRFKDFWR